MLVILTPLLLGKSRKQEMLKGEDEETGSGNDINQILCMI